MIKTPDPNASDIARVKEALGVAPTPEEYFALVEDMRCLRGQCERLRVLVHIDPKLFQAIVKLDAFRAWAIRNKDAILAWREERDRE